MAEEVKKQEKVKEEPKKVAKEEPKKEEIKEETVKETEESQETQESQVEEKVEEKEEPKIKIDSLKNYIKGLAKDEVSLKSISFSSNEEKKEFVCYFAWQQEFYNKYFVERDIFRKQIISYMEKYGYRLNKKLSTAAKYVFNK